MKLLNEKMFLVLEFIKLNEKTYFVKIMKGLDLNPKTLSIIITTLNDMGAIYRNAPSGIFHNREIGLTKKGLNLLNNVWYPYLKLEVLGWEKT